MPYVDHLYFESLGSGRPVVLVHCPALNHRYWSPVMQRLAHRCETFAVDLPGHGQSSLGGRPWTIHSVAEQLLTLINRLKLERPILIGYSSGVPIALQMALDAPAVVSSVVAVSGFPECTTLHLQTKIGLGRVATRLGLSRWLGASIVRTNHVDRTHALSMLPMARTVHPEALMAFLRESQRVDLTSRLPHLEQPVLLIYGDKDRWMRKYARIFVANLPHSELQVVPRSDHRVPTRRPDEFVRLVETFLERA